jgi:hypothetical protein
MNILELVRRCTYCNSDMTSIPSDAYASNPFCDGCFNQRVQEESSKLGDFSVQFQDGWATISSTRQTHL